MELRPYLERCFCEGRVGVCGSRYVFREGGKTGRG